MSRSNFLLSIVFRSNFVTVFVRGCTMSKLNLLGNVLKSNGLLHKPNQGLRLLLRESPRSFSTGTEQKNPSPDPFLEPPTRCLIYGRLMGLGRHLLKTDVIQFFDGCELTKQDIKVDYNRIYSPVAMVLQFSSPTAFDLAQRQLNRKGRLYKLVKVDRGQWDPITSYDGKVALLQGIPRNALPEDVERFLCGCNFDASSLQIFVRQGLLDPMRMALVHFPTQIEAMNAVRMRNRSFCLNNPIMMRVLQ
eukprot:TRINITY_DN1670_c1_g3_i1.p1 TRINITY_DN1670_c1_g3~~TRINITY_DN1670_c1_g3_i1.p1  ORF type:complete len:248 (-),score=16.15 TRINITY_DN1670_c1_g3_i1:265-1008(-)